MPLFRVSTPIKFKDDDGDLLINRVTSEIVKILKKDAKVQSSSNLFFLFVCFKVALLLTVNCKTNTDLVFLSPSYSCSMWQ